MEPKFDKWPELKEKYIYEMMSLRNLAQEYKGQISDTAIFNKSSKENWPNLRLEHWAEVERNLGEKLNKKVVDAKESLFNAGFYLFGKGITQLQKNIKKAEEEGKEINDKQAMELFKMGTEILYKFMDQKVDINTRFSSINTENKIANILMKIYGDDEETEEHTLPQGNSQGEKITAPVTADVNVAKMGLFSENPIQE